MQDIQQLVVLELLVLVVQELKWDGLLVVVAEHLEVPPQQHRLEDLKVELDLLVLLGTLLLRVVVLEDMVEPMVIQRNLLGLLLIQKMQDFLVRQALVVEEEDVGHQQVVLIQVVGEEEPL